MGRFPILQHRIALLSKNHLEALVYKCSNLYGRYIATNWDERSMRNYMSVQSAGHSVPSMPVRIWIECAMRILTSVA